MVGLEFIMRPCNIYYVVTSQSCKNEDEENNAVKRNKIGGNYGSVNSNYNINESEENNARNIIKVRDNLFTIYLIFTKMTRKIMQRIISISSIT